MTNKPMSDRELAAWIVAVVALLCLFIITLAFITGDTAHGHHLQQISGSHWQAPTRPTP